MMIQLKEDMAVIVGMRSAGKAWLTGKKETVRLLKSSTSPCLALSEFGSESEFVLGSGSCNLSITRSHYHPSFSFASYKTHCHCCCRVSL